MLPNLGTIARASKKPSLGRAFNDRSVAFANKAYSKPIKTSSVKAIQVKHGPGQIKTAEDILSIIEKRANYEVDYDYQEPSPVSGEITGAKIGGTVGGLLGVIGGRDESKRIHRKIPELHSIKTILKESRRGGIRGALAGALTGAGTVAYLKHRSSQNGQIN